MGHMDPARFARAIAAARKHLGESQTDFAQRFGVGRQTVARWEVGAAFPSELTRASIGDGMDEVPPALRVEIETALGGEPPPPLLVAPVSAAPQPTVDARAVMEAIVFRTAEDLDLGPRGVREAIANALAEMDRRGVSVQAGYEALRSSPPVSS